MAVIFKIVVSVLIGLWLVMATMILLFAVYCIVTTVAVAIEIIRDKYKIWRLPS